MIILKVKNGVPYVKYIRVIQNLFHIEMKNRPILFSNLKLKENRIHVTSDNRKPPQIVIFQSVDFHLIFCSNIFFYENILFFTLFFVYFFVNQLFYFGNEKTIGE